MSQPQRCFMIFCCVILFALMREPEGEKRELNQGVVHVQNFIDFSKALYAIRLRVRYGYDYRQTVVVTVVVAVSAFESSRWSAAPDQYRRAIVMQKGNILFGSSSQERRTPNLSRN